MRGEKTFGVRVEGVYPSSVKKYGPIIHIDKYYGSNRKKTGTNVIKFERELIEKEYPRGKIPSIVEDLLNVSLATFAADKLVKRDILIGSYKRSRYFTRKIELIIPVSDKKRWREVNPYLEKAVSFMTYDAFKYRFITRKSKEKDISADGDCSDSIALFSGGLDSFAGSYYLRKNGYNPIFVSINHANIGTILSNLYEILPKNSAREIGVNPRNLATEEYTQFSRSFLYISFAVAIALAHENIEKIFIPENGIIARQIGLKEGRYGTRTAHPQFLGYYNDFIRHLFPKRKISVENPFSFKTKTEIVENIEHGKKIKNTISCSHTLFLEKGKEPEHCGMCIPCLIRIISIVASDFPDAEKILKLRFNPFTEIDFENPPGEMNTNDKTIKNYYRDGFVNVMDLIRLAVEIKNRPYDKVVIKYPEFMDTRVYDLYKRFSVNILKTVDFYSTENPSLKKVVECFQ